MGDRGGARVRCRRLVQREVDTRLAEGWLATTIRYLDYIAPGAVVEAIVWVIANPYDTESTR